MRSIIGYIVVLIALATLTTLDDHASDSNLNGESAYYSDASFASPFKSGKAMLTKNKSAQQKRAVAMSANEKLAIWPERVLKVKNHNYLLAQAFAVREDEFTKDMGKVLMKQDGFVVFEASDDTTIESFIVRANKFPVVIGEFTGDLGVVTGNVVIKVKSPEVAGLIASVVKSEIVSVNDTTKTATLKLPAEQDLTEVIHTIRDYAGVESAEFQVLTGKGT